MCCMYNIPYGYVSSVTLGSLVYVNGLCVSIVSVNTYVRIIHFLSDEGWSYQIILHTTSHI